MGILDGLKEFYFGLEGRYYDALDRVNNVVPVYEIVDPVDKIVPSFALLILLFVLAIAFIVLGAAGGLPLFNDTLMVSVNGTNGIGISGVNITFSANGEKISSIQTDSAGIVKLAGVKSSQAIDVVAEKDGYLSARKTIIISGLPAAETIVLEGKLEGSETRTIRLLDDLGQPIAASFTLSFKCSNPYAPIIPQKELTPADGGVATVEVPGNCERLSVDIVDSSAHQELYGYSVTGTDQAIYLEAADTENANITVNVQDAAGSPVDGIQVELYKYSEILSNPDVGPIDVSYTAGGQAVFTKAAGAYIIKTYDAQGNHSEATSERVSVAAGGSKSVNLRLIEHIVGKVMLRAVDRESGTAVANATVKLFLAAAPNAEITTVKSGPEGVASINVSRDVEYRAIISAEGYQAKTVGGLRITTTAANVELGKCTPSTCGSLNVKVVDQDGAPVGNATVMLYSGSTNFMAGYANRTSDINGMAKFFGVGTGNYYAFAFKESVSGRSDAQYFNTSQSGTSEPALTVTMNVPDGIVQVSVKDVDGKAVPFATIGIFDARTNTLIGRDITDFNGVKEFTLRADRKMYAVVSKQDREAVYANYTTAKKPILPSSVVQFNVTLEKPSLKQSLEMEFLGLFAADGKRAQNLKAGEDGYIARFRVRVPEELDYDTMGIHIRTGDDVLMEKDELLIREVNAPKTSQIRATRFEGEASSLDELDYETTVGDAKWVNLLWSRPQAGIYEAEAAIRVKDSASIGDKLSFYYRAWGEYSNGKRDRFPADDTVTREIYSNTKQEVFQIGVVTLCDESFCFTSTIKDEKNDLVESVQDTYNAKVFNPYKLQFIITNNSETRIHNNANLRISNADESLKFFDYTATDAETQQTRGTLNGFEFPRFNVGDLRPKSSVRFEAEFTTQKAVNGILNITLVSDQAIAFEKNLTVIVAAPKELSVEVEPAVFLSGVQNDVKITVTDAANGLEAEGAVVRVKDRRKNVLDYAVTGKDGAASLTLPGEKPGEKLYIEVEKIDYNVKTVELQVSDQLFRISPQQLGVSLNTKNKQQSEDKLSITNSAPYALQIKSIGLSGAFRKLIDAAKVRNWLDSSYRGIVVKEGEKKEISLKTFLTQDALALSNRQDIEAELTIVASNFGQEWVFKVPVKIAIGLGDEVDDPSCLTVSRSEWNTSTSGTPKRMEFQIQNNCTVGRKPVALQSLEAKVGWRGNELGEYSLNIGPDQVVLRQGYYRILLGTLKAEQSLTGILTFTPYGGVNGIGEADVVIQATNPLEAEDQVLQNTIKTKINSVNLKTCLSYDKERVAIKQDETGTVTVTANEICGEPVNFSIKSDLRTDPKSEFTLIPGQSQAIKVYSEKNYPGQYALYVLPKFSSDRREQLEKNIRVVVNAAGCWQLSKYEFDVYDDPRSEFDGFDTANLTNTCVDRPVTVKVNSKDWMDAAQDGIFWGLLSMGAVMLTNYSKGDYDWLSGKPTGAGQNEYISQLEAQRQQALANKDYQAAAELQGRINAAKGTEPVTPVSTGVAGSYVVDSYGDYTLLSDGLWYDGKGELVSDGSQIKGLWAAIVGRAGGAPSGRQGTAGMGAGAAPREPGPGGTISTQEPVTSTDVIGPGGTILQQEPVTATDLTNAGAQMARIERTALGASYTGYTLNFNNSGKIVSAVDNSGINVTAAELSRLQDAYDRGQMQIAPYTPASAPPGSAVLITGLAPANSAGSSFFGGAASGAGGSLTNSLLSGGGGLVRNLLGTSPWVGGLFGFAVGTIASYMGQEKEVTFTVLSGDTEINDVRLVNGSGPAEKEDTDIQLDAEGLRKEGGSNAATNPQPLVNNADLLSQGIETLKLTFTNITGFITTEEAPKTPYPFLKATGVRHEYKDKVYDKKDFVVESGGFVGFFDQPKLDKTRTKLDEATSKNLEQRYRLEFNSIPPQVETSQPIGLLNCQDGIRVGSTGADALPKTKLAWSWSAIGKDECNEDNPNGIYCDATQFSISLLKKVNELSAFVQQKGPSFACPSPIEDNPATNEIGSFDIGVESVSAAKSGVDVEVIAAIKNTNPGAISANIAIKLQKGQGAAGEIACPTGSRAMSVGAGGTAEARCTFRGMPQGMYNAKVDITPSVSCQNCQDIVATNSLSRTVFVGQSGLQQCEPYSTARIAEFLRASAMERNDNVVKLAKFNALLMVDGYSTDFQHDFDLAQKQAFFSAPDYYNNAASGLGVYFKDPKLWSFDAYSQPDFTLPGPGTYSVTIDIVFKDNTWKLFDARGNPNATITVSMEKLHGAEPDSPFYYTPFDGLVGQEDGRIGYGVNFNGDSILLDNSQTPLRTVEIAGSSPIDEGTLSVTRSKSFKSMQVDNKGVVARLSRQGGNPALLFQPSNATPVILQIAKKTGEDAYAVYEPAVDGSAIDVGQQLALWNGIGASCRGFDDRVMAQQQFVPDTHGLSTKCALVGQNPRSKYALEFCGKPVNFGMVSYETVFYTPQDSDSYLKLVDVASDDAQLISSSSSGKSVPLNGNGQTRQINSLQDVFSLVDSGYLCVTGTNLNAEFFWNPKKVFETFQQKEEAALDACIGPKNRTG